MTSPPEIEIKPEPGPEERAVIEAAVAAMLSEKSNEPGAWWRAGVDGDDDEPDPR